MDNHDTYGVLHYIFTQGEAAARAALLRKMIASGLLE
jgi:hypothetical protein